MLPTKIEPLPSACDRDAKSTGEIDIQLCETGKVELDAQRRPGAAVADQRLLDRRVRVEQVRGR